MACGKIILCHPSTVWSFPCITGSTSTLRKRRDLFQRVQDKVPSLFSTVLSQEKMGKGCKVVVCGLLSVGKTAILEQLLYGNHTIGKIILLRFSLDLELVQDTCWSR